MGGTRAGPVCGRFGPSAPAGTIRVSFHRLQRESEPSAGRRGGKRSLESPHPAAQTLGRGTEGRRGLTGTLKQKALGKGPDRSEVPSSPRPVPHDACPSAPAGGGTEGSRGGRAYTVGPSAVPCQPSVPTAGGLRGTLSGWLIEA